VRGSTKKRPWAQWYDARPHVPHGHNQEGELGNAGLFFSIVTVLAFNLLHAPRRGLEKHGGQQPRGK
jgi:hypothetical protein